MQINTDICVTSLPQQIHYDGETETVETHKASTALLDCKLHTVNCLLASECREQ